jgi:branched-chain amino acid transport system substrate-binding protein
VRRAYSRGLVAAMAASALVLSACGGDSDEGGDGDGGNAKELTIGFVGAQTGPNAQLGINPSNGVELALEQHNAKPGVTKVNLIKYDTQGDPAQATNQVKKAVSDGVVAVVGPVFSGESKTGVPILEEAGIPNVSPSATAVALASNGWKTWHRVLANDDVQGPGVADWMATTLAAKNVAVIDDQSEYGKGLADAVRKQLGSKGVKIAVNESLNPEESSFASTINAVKPANPDAIFFGGYYAAAGKLIKQLRDSGVQGTFVSGDGSLDAQFISGGGEAANGALLSCTCSSAIGSTDAEVQKFATDYKTKWNADPATYSAEGYDAANIILKAIDEGKTTTEDINEYLKTVDYKGISKPIKFTDTGELQGDLLFISEVKDGKIAFLGDTTQAKPSN